MHESGKRQFTTAASNAARRNPEFCSLKREVVSTTLIPIGSFQLQILESRANNKTNRKGRTKILTFVIWRACRNPPRQKARNTPRSEDLSASNWRSRGPGGLKKYGIIEFFPEDDDNVPSSVFRLVPGMPGNISRLSQVHPPPKRIHWAKNFFLHEPEHPN